MGDGGIHRRSSGLAPQRVHDQRRAALSAGFADSLDEICAVEHDCRVGA
jgi:hypothetical protein